MHIFIIAFVIGAFALQSLKTLPAFALSFGALLLISLANLVCYYTLSKQKFTSTICSRHIKLLRFFLVSLLAFCIGCNWSLICAKHTLHWKLPTVLEVKNINIIGYVASLPKIESRRISFVFDVVKFADKPTRTKFLLSWYNDYPSHPQFKCGDKWQLTVRLKRPHSALNPGQFDREASLFQNRIRATGYVYPEIGNRCIESKWYNYSINRLRQYLQVKVEENLKGKPLANMIVALVVGDQSGLSQKQWQVLRQTGTIHFMIIAGLHIGFVAGFMFFFGHFFWRLWPRLTLYLPAQDVGSISALFGALIYSTLAGFSIPTQRATIMLAVFVMNSLYRRNIPIGNALLLALFFVVLLDPLAGLNSGFCLSFAAVALITYSLGARLKPEGKFHRYNRLQVTLNLGLIPLILLFFHQIPLLSFFTNAITIPSIGFIVIPLSLSGAFLLLFYQPLGHLLLILGEKVLEFIWHWLEWFANLPIAAWHHYIYNNWILTASLFAMLIFLTPRGFPRRWIGLFWLLPLFCFRPSVPKYGEIWFTLLDVGQGLAAVVRTHDHVLVYDTGPKYNDGSSAGQSIILPFLRSIGAKQIDMLVVSHKDLDHSGGAFALLSSFPVKKFITSAPEFFAPVNAGKCFSGQSWTWDGVNFSILHPPSSSLFADNNASCVLRIASGENSILLDGDIEKPAEEFLVKTAREQLATKILIAPHHGSRTSSSMPFIVATKTQYALFATGYRNRFHFPNKGVIKRYLQNNMLLLNTAETGAITFKLDAKSDIRPPEIYRQRFKRYWRDD